MKWVKMSDLQDIIAYTAQKAYQEGLRREREQWQSRLDRIKTWNPESHQAFVDGVIQEQERIIRLLETSALNAYDDSPVTMNDGIKACIALIKGEQK